MRHFLIVCIFALVAAPLHADDWPAWRGPTGQGYCFEKNVPVKWSDKENVKWKIKLEQMGNSTPIIWKDRIFLTMAEKDGFVRSLVCFDRADGKQLWRNDIKYAEKEQNWTRDWYANASPTTDGERLYVSLGSAGLHCFDLAGKEIWKRTDLGKWEHRFGNGSSPILYQDLCILWLGPNEKTGGINALLAVDKSTGKTVWKRDQDTLFKKDKSAGFWGTPIIVPIDGMDQLLFCPGHTLESVDPKTGKDLWTCEGLMEFVYTSPLYSPEHKVVVAMSGYSKSALAVKVTGSAKYLKSDLLWHHPKNDQRVGSGIIVGDHVYIQEEGTLPGGIGPKCYELKTGKEVWEQEKKSGIANWGSMVHVDGKLYVLMRDGSTIIYKASPKFEILATNRLSKGESTNSSPAISNGEIFLRTNQHLWCISEKK